MKKMEKWKKKNKWKTWKNEKMAKTWKNEKNGKKKQVKNEKMEKGKRMRKMKKNEKMKKMKKWKKRKNEKMKKWKNEKMKKNVKKLWIFGALTTYVLSIRLPVVIHDKTGSLRNWSWIPLNLFTLGVDFLTASLPRIPGHVIFSLYFGLAVSSTMGSAFLHHIVRE